MSLRTSTVPDDIAFALLAAHNQRQVDAIASFFHLSQTESTNRSNYMAPTVTRLRVLSANASDLATSVTLVNEVKLVLNQHFPDLVAHDTVASAAIATADATDLATGITLANAMKAAYNTHLSAANVHFTNDGTNTTAATNASDQATLNTLLNEMKTDINAHLASAPAGTFIDSRP